MTTIAEAIRDHLINDGTLQSLLKASTQFRKVYPGKKPDSVAYPAIVVTGTEKKRPADDQLKIVANTTTLVIGTFDFDCKAKTFGEADKIRERLRLRLRQSQNGAEWAGMEIHGLRIQDDDEDVETATDGSDDDVFVQILEAEITYREAI
jgi:hypothetical protein